MFLVQGVTGYSDNQFLYLTAAELDLLDRYIGVRGSNVQEATPEILSQLNPMQLSSTDNPNVKRLFADIGIELPQAQAPVEEEGPGIIDRFKSMFTTEEGPVSAGEQLLGQEITTDQPPAFAPQFPGDVPPNAKVLPGNPDNPFNLPDPTTKIGEFAQGILTMPSKYYDAGKFLFDKQADLGKAIVGGVVNAPEYLMSDSEQLIQEREEQDVAAQSFRDDEARRVETQGGLQSTSIADSQIAQKQVNDEIARQEAEEAAAKDKAQKAADSTTRMSEQGPNFVFDPEKIKKEIDEGGSGSNSIIGDATGTNQDLSPKDSVKAFQAMYKEMLGMDDEDKEKEKWHQMAMIGFAIAAGQDPNALSNIAGGLLEGTKMAKKDRARKQDRDDKITMMAIQSAEADRRDRMAEERAIRAEGRKTETAEGVATTSYERALTTAKNLAEANFQKEIAKSGGGQDMSPLEPIQDAIRTFAETLISQGIVTDPQEAVDMSDAVIRPYYSNGSTQNLNTGAGRTTSQVIKDFKDAGKSDLEIRKMLIDANKDPTKFGL